MLNSPGLSILVVDDESAFRQNLARTVSAAGFGVNQAVDGIDALQKLQAGHYDIVITDIHMPNMDGLQLLDEIRTRYPETKVILIAGHGSSTHSKEMRSAGADDLISKPFHNHEIVHKLRQCSLRSRRGSTNPDTKG